MRTIHRAPAAVVNPRAAPPRLLPILVAPSAMLAMLALAACGDASLPSGHWQGTSSGGSLGASSSSGSGSSSGSSGGAGSSSGGAATSSSGSGGANSSGSSSGAAGSSSGSASSSSGSSSGGPSGSSSGGSSSGSGSSSGGAPAPNLAVSVDQGSVQMQLLAESTVKVSVAPNGYSGSVTLQAGALPAGVTAKFAPASVMLDGTTLGTSTLTLATVDSTPPGTVAVDVQAMAAGDTAHASVSVAVQPTITIHIPSGVNGLGGTTSNPVKDAYGPYPFKIAAPTNMSASAPVTVYFMNDDGVSHEIHADNPQQGFGHDPGSFGAHTMDPYIRKVTVPGSYTFYLHDQGAPITVGLVEIQ